MKPVLEALHTFKDCLGDSLALAPLAKCKRYCTFSST